MSKKDRMRECPVVGMAIDAVDCGIKRGPDFGCPEACPHNPWSAANYGRAGDTESKVLRLVQTIVFDALGPVAAKRMLNAYPEEDDGGLRFNAAMIAAAYGRQPDGTSVVGRWIEANARTLKNDERVFLRCLASTRASVLEVHKVVDDRTVEVVDLLDPERRVVRMVDFRGAASARRFQTSFGFSFEMPHFLRMSGNRMNVQGLLEYEPDEVIRIIARHLGWSEGQEESLANWLLKHGAEVFDSIEEVNFARQRLRIEKSRLEWIKVEFPPAKGKPVDRTMAAAVREARRVPWLLESGADDEIPDGAVAFDAFAPEDVGEPELFAPDGGPAGRTSRERGRCAGRLTIGPRAIVFEGLGSDLFDRTRAELGSTFARLTGPAKVEVRDLGGDGREKSGREADPRLVPEALLTDVGRIEVATQRTALIGPNDDEEEERQWIVTMAYMKQYEGFIDEPIPALDGRTPREASRDPELRPVLVRLMKQHVQRCDDQRFQRRLDIDLNPLLEDLGLDELIFPAPPLPPVSEEEMERLAPGEAPGDDWPDDDEGEGGESLPDIDTLAEGGLDPLPPQKSLNVGVVRRRFKALERLESPQGLIDRVDEAWPDFLADLLDLAGPDVPVRERTFILLHAVLAAHILFGGQMPKGTRIDAVRLADAFDVHEALVIRWLEDACDAKHDIDEILAGLEAKFAGHPQPALLQWLVETTMSAAGAGDEPLVADSSLALVIAGVLAALWELCRFAK